MSILDNPLTRLALDLALLAVIMAVVPLFFPALPFPSLISQALTYFFTLLWKWDWIFPVSDVIWLMWFTLYFELIILAVRLVLWLFRWLTPKGRKT